MSARRVMDAIGANMVLRVGSFGMSMLLTRLSTPDSRGMSFQADVVVNTVGFISREALRCLYATYPHKIRYAKKAGQREEAMAGLLTVAGLVVPFAIIAMFLLELLALVLPIPSASRLAFVTESTSLIPLATWIIGLLIEWSCEPLVAIATACQAFRIRVVAEALALALSKGAAVLALLAGGAYVSEHPSLLVGLQQVIYGIVTAIVLLFCIFILPKEQHPTAEVGDKKSSTVEEDKKDDLTLKEAQKLAVAVWRSSSVGSILSNVLPIEVKARSSEWLMYFRETVLRLILTEGEKLILSAYVAIGGQGVFDVVNTLGSLVARLVFRVWEEGSFTVWKSKLSAADERFKELSGEEQNGNQMAPEAWEKKRAANRLASVEKECLPMLQSLIRLCFYIGSFTLILSQPLPRFALAFLFSNRWAGDEATSVLRLFCAYIPLMGINGLLEAFLRATASSSVFNRMQQLMIGTSILSIGTTLVFVKTLEMGVVGLMTASVLNVLVRMCVNVYLLSQYIRGAPLKILQLGRMGPLLGLVIAANVGFACLGGYEVGSVVSMRGVGVAAGLVIGALAAIAPLAYINEKRGRQSSKKEG